MTDEELWDDEREIKDVDEIEEPPEWIKPDTTVSQLMAIEQGGCDSGAYMPAVTYYDAAQTMAKHGNDVLQYIQDALGELPRPKPEESWSGLACFYLSSAVELWALTTLAELRGEA